MNVAPYRYFRSSLLIVSSARRHFISASKLSLPPFKPVLKMQSVLSFLGFSRHQSTLSGPELEELKRKANESPRQMKDEEWREILDPQTYYVAREKGTERPFTSNLNDEKRKGTFHCACCSQPLFQSATKFNSGTGWPSFWQPISPESVKYISDKSHFMVRVEVLCSKCDGHLGHVFNDGPNPTGKRYCMNGVSLKFKPEK